MTSRPFYRREKRTVFRGIESTRQPPIFPFSHLDGPSYPRFSTRSSPFPPRRPRRWNFLLLLFFTSNTVFFLTFLLLLFLYSGLYTLHEKCISARSFKEIVVLGKTAPIEYCTGSRISIQLSVNSVPQLAKLISISHPNRNHELAKKLHSKFANR